MDWLTRRLRALWQKDPVRRTPPGDSRGNLLADADEQLAAGNLESAREIFAEAARLAPDDPVPLYGLMKSLHRLGHIESAMTCLDAITQDFPDFLPALRYSLAHHLETRQWQAAGTLARRLSELSEGQESAALCVTAAHAYRLGNCAEEALSATDHGIDREPGLPGLWIERGQALRLFGRLDEAEDCFNRVLAVTPDDRNAMAGLAGVQRDRGEYAAALTTCEALTAVHPDDPWSHIERQITLEFLGNLPEAIDACRHAHKLEPSLPDPLINLSYLLALVGEFDDAVQCAEEAIRLDPHLPQPHLNLAMLLLRMGRLAPAWRHYQWRFAMAMGRDYPAGPVPADPAIRLPGDMLPVDFRGKRVTLVEDQGLGDELSFLRFAPLLRQRGARVTYVPPDKIDTLVARANVVDTVLPRGATAPPDTEIYLAPGDLPLVLGIDTLEALPPPVALAVLPDRAHAIAERIGAFRVPGRALIGLTWRAGTHHARGGALFKSVSLEVLGALLRDLGADIVVLQRKPLAGEIAALEGMVGRRVLDFSALNDDLESMLAALDCLDDYVTVSNTNVHLRAGLGKRCRVLVPFPPDYRWMAAGGTSPWFPGMPIYRQAAGGAWDEALKALRTDLVDAYGIGPTQPGIGPAGLQILRLSPPAANGPAVVFLTANALDTDAGGRPSSALASIRYRVLLPGMRLAGRDVAVSVVAEPPGGWPHDAADRIPEGIVVVSKTFSPATLDLARQLKRQGRRLVADFCDHHFDHPEIGGLQVALARLADTVIAGTPTLAEAIATHCGRNAAVVPDPFEGPIGSPAFAPTFPALRLLWFGHPSNLDSMQALLGGLGELAREMPLTLTLLTAEIPGLDTLGKPVPAGSRLTVRHRPWSTESLWRELRECDLVLIPSSADAKNRVKGANRLVETLRAGRLAIAFPLPAYAEFGDFCLLTQDIVGGIRRALADPPACLARIRAGQGHIAHRHSPLEIARHWERALGLTPAAVRVNLGCGDKLLPGYINVDGASRRLGREPDVIADLRDLSCFPDGIADEALSVHAIEHLWQWEALPAVREWVRILKPGGQLIVECPNLATACARFCENPALSWRPDQTGNQTMWVFYGDPNWRDPLMAHRWGYVPQSLIDLMRAAGLDEVRQEPAQFKLKEPRDMRIVGRKPEAGP